MVVHVRFVIVIILDSQIIVVTNGELEEHDGEDHMHHDNFSGTWTEGRIVINPRQLQESAYHHRQSGHTYQFHEGRSVEKRRVWIQSTEIPIGIFEAQCTFRELDILDFRKAASMGVQCSLQERLIRLVVRIGLNVVILRIIHVPRVKVGNVNLHSEDGQCRSFNGTQIRIPSRYSEIS